MCTTHKRHTCVTNKAYHNMSGGMTTIKVKNTCFNINVKNSNEYKIDNYIYEESSVYTAKQDSIFSILEL
jgi:hypothetical protein